jgi:hypothetical protein
VSRFSIPLSGHISDRIGRKKMYLIGAASVGFFGFLYFGMVDTAIPSAVFVAIVLSLIPHDMQYGPQAALSRSIHPAVALQRGLSRLPACLRDRWRTGASYRNSFIRRIWHWLCHCDLYSCLRCREPCGGGFHA